MRRPCWLIACLIVLCMGYTVYQIGWSSHSSFRLKISDVTSVRPVIKEEEDYKNNLLRFRTKTCSANSTYVDFGATLTQEQTERVDQCIIHYYEDSADGLVETQANMQIRYISHAYLNSNSFVIDAGGHLGVDINELKSRYHPGLYVVLEPVEKFYKIWVEIFESSPNIEIYKYGIDAADGTFYANNNDKDGTSIYRNTGTGDDRLEIVAVPTFFEKLMVRHKIVDLITLNCEGCEYAVLDLLLSTDYIHYFRNIQYQSHRISGICHPVKRFCWYQELLPKTHQLTFQHKFWWESLAQK